VRRHLPHIIGGPVLDRSRETKLPKPREIKEFLDEYVVGRRRRSGSSPSRLQPLQADRLLREERKLDVELQKSNILLIGHRNGKTLCQTLARMLSVPSRSPTPRR